MKEMTKLEVRKRDWAILAQKNPIRWVEKYFRNIDRIWPDIQYDIAEYRQNGVVIKKNGKYYFNPVSDTDLKEWRATDWKPMDVSDQFTTKPTPTQRFGPVMEKSRTSIITQPQRFQGRETDFSGDTVRAIVAKGFYDKSASPIKVWFDAGLDKYVVLAGHSRLAAFDQLVTQGKAKGPVPVIEFLGDEDDAMDYAIIESNRKSTEEGLISDLNAYRRAVKQGKSRKYLLSVFKPESKINKLQKLSHLNPTGRFIELLSGTSSQSFPYIERNAQWIGDMRSQLPQLSNAHELEIFKFIYEGGKGLKLDKNQLYKVVNDRVNRIDFDKTEPLNLENRVSSNAYTNPINEAIAEITKEIENSKREVDRKRETIARAKTEFTTIKTGEGLRITSPILKRIDDLNRYILKKVEEREALRQKAGMVERTMTADLFSIAEKPKEPFYKKILVAANEKLGITYWNQFVKDGTLDPESRESIANTLKLFDEGKRPNGGLRADLESEKLLGPPNPKPGHYYVTAVDGHGTYFVLGPFTKHADAIKNVHFAKKYTGEVAWNKFHAFMKWGTVGYNGEVPFPFIDADLWKHLHPKLPQPNPASAKPTDKDLKPASAKPEWLTMQDILDYETKMGTTDISIMSRPIKENLPATKQVDDVVLVTRQYGPPMYIMPNPDDKKYGFTATDKLEEAVRWKSNNPDLPTIIYRAKFITGWEELKFEKPIDNLVSKKLESSGKRTPVKRWTELVSNEVVIYEIGGKLEPFALMFSNKGSFRMKNGRVHPKSTLESTFKPLASDQALVNTVIEGAWNEANWNKHPQYKPAPTKDLDLLRKRAKAFAFAQAQRLRLLDLK